jgi:hypothetical protein
MAGPRRQDRWIVQAARGVGSVVAIAAGVLLVGTVIAALFVWTMGAG